MAADALVFDFGSVAFLGLIARKSSSAPTLGVASDGFGYWSVGGCGCVWEYHLDTLL